MTRVLKKKAIVVDEDDEGCADGNGRGTAWYNVRF